MQRSNPARAGTPAQSGGRVPAPSPVGMAASIVSLLAGIWLVVFTWVAGGQDADRAVVATLVTGLAIAILALIRIVNRPRLAGLSWVNALLGGWLIVSPLILGYGDRPNADALTWSNIIAGGLVLLASVGSETTRLVGRGRGKGE